MLSVADTSFVYTITTSVRTLHHSLEHTLSDGDATAELNCTLWWHGLASPTQETFVNIVYIVSAMTV